MDPPETQPFSSNAEERTEFPSHAPTQVYPGVLGLYGIPVRPLFPQAHAQSEPRWGVGRGGVIVIELLGGTSHFDLVTNVYSDGQVGACTPVRIV